ncbi:MAG: ECF transporter S component [Oscillospiraceae bacterium]|nr:ECF transporter S component [Oscillospiraceae bacterium]
MVDRKNSSLNYNQKRLLFIVQFTILLAIEAIVCFTPLGSLPAVGPIVATLSHIPVIITAMVMGTGAGAAMGFFFGLFSFLVMTFMPPSPIAFVFTPFYSVGEIGGNYWSLVICFVPRILIGVVAGLSYRSLSRLFNDNFWSYTISGILGSLTNTLLVLGGIYLFFGEQFASVNNVGFNLVLGILGMTVLTSGIPEAIIGGVLAYGVGKPLNKLNAAHL